MTRMHRTHLKSNYETHSRSCERIIVTSSHVWERTFSGMTLMLARYPIIEL